MILFFSNLSRLLPSSGSGTFLHLLMPAFTLAGTSRPPTCADTLSMLEVLGSEYIKLARLKGLPEALVIGKHALKNALIPVVTLAGINLVVMINVASWSRRCSPAGHRPAALRGHHLPRLPGRAGGGGDRRAMIIVVNLLVDVLYARLIAHPSGRLKA